ncbi:MAG: hypothetical protein GX591_15985 [Planctomycetes bacterium]|nr:hypothetical protein [Planctomycetota bacterium]
MRYRIRYQQSSQQLMTEIEANSPDEAVVKFQHLQEAPRRPSGGPPRVMSVSMADGGEAWS